MWSARIDRDGPWELTCLSFEESRHARHFTSVEDRRRYARSHAFVRSILGNYVDADPVEIELRTDPGGKPRIAGSTLRFNSSHSLRWCVVAVSLSEVGIDIEDRNVEFDRDVAARVMTDCELAGAEALPADERNEAFLRAWTRAEALAKATGDGLAALGPRKSRGGWSFLTVDPDASAVATLATLGEGWRVSRCS